MYSSNKMMLGFVKRSLLFAMAVVLVSTISYAFNNYLFSTDHYKMPKSKVNLLMGDSYTLAALNPKIIDNSVNIALAQEPYIVQYFILKQVLEHNPSVQTVSLPLSPVYFTSVFNDIFLLENLSLEMFSRIYPIVGNEEFENIPYNNRTYISSFIRHEVLPNGTYISNRFTKFLSQGLLKYPYIGRFNYRSPIALGNRDCVEEVNKLFSEKPVVVHGAFNFQYLDSIINISAKNNIKVFLIEFPIYSCFKEHIPEIIFEHLAIEKERLEKSYHNLEMVDLSDFINDEALFENCTHVNVLGAEKVSLYMNRLINPPNEESE